MDEQHSQDVVDQQTPPVTDPETQSTEQTTSDQGDGASTDPPEDAKDGAPV